MIPIETWRTSGRTVPTPDGQVWLRDSATASDGSTAEPARGTPVLVLHGFPTSSWDFASAMAHLEPDQRFVAFDFLGFGLSDKPVDYGYSLFEQADVACQVVRSLSLSRVHLWAHDMGTSVATELLARRERGLVDFEIASLVLMNGSVHVELADLTVGQRILRSPLGETFARLNNALTFKAQLRRVFGRPPSTEELDVMWGLVRRADGAARLAQAIRYVEERTRYRRRWIGALERLDVPALVAWGRRDPVAVHAIADELAGEIPRARRVTWDDLGHYPQTEDPPRVAEALRAFWAGVEGEPRASSRRRS